MKKVLLFTLSLILIFLTNAHPVSAWWNDTFEHRREITVTDNWDSDLENFPVYFTLNTSKLIGEGKLQADADDLRVIASDDTTILNYEYELKSVSDNSTNSSIWFKANLTNGVDYTFFVYYGNNSVSGVADASAVWSNGYEAVWHFNESSGNLLDVTGNGYDASTTFVEGYQETGEFGHAYYFNGSNYADFGDVLDITTQNATIFIRYRFYGGDLGTDTVKLIQKQQNFQTYVDSGNQTNSALHDGVWNSAGGSNLVVNGSWVTSTLMYNHTSLNNYLNDSLDGYTVYSGNPTGSGFSLAIGAGYSLASALNWYFEGLIDEARFSLVERTHEWVTASARQPFTVSVGNEQANEFFFDRGYSYNSSDFELTYQNYGYAFDYNTTALNNVTVNAFLWNGTVYSITDYNEATTGDYKNVTVNYTNYLIPLIQSNATSVNFAFNITQEWANNTNYTIVTNQTININYGLYTNSSTNITNIIGGDDVKLSSTLNNETTTGATSVIVFYDWNGTNYTATGTYHRDFSIASVTSNQTLNYTVYLNVTRGSTTYTRAESEVSLTIVAFQFDNCDSYTSKILNFTVYWEDNDTTTYTDLNLQVVASDGRQWNLSYDNKSNPQVCVTPAWFNSTVDVDAYFEYLETNITHLRRQHFLRNIRIDNTTYDAILRVNASATSQITIPVEDSSGNEATGYILVFEKWNNSDGYYYNVVHEIVDNAGNAVINIVCDKYYRSVVKDASGNTIHQGGKTFIKCGVSEIDVVEVGSTSDIGYFDIYGSLVYSISPNLNNNTVLTVTTIDGTSNTVWLNVSKNFENLCSLSTNSDGAQLTCSLGNYTDNIYLIEVYVQDSDGYFVLIYDTELDYTEFASYEEDALIAGILFLIILTFSVLNKPVIAVVTLVVGVAGLRYIHIFQNDFTSTIAFVALGVAVIMLMGGKKNG